MAAAAEHIAILALTSGALALGEKLAAALPARLVACRGRVRAAFETCWQECGALVCIMASGIVVRQIAPLLADKYRDPAVLVLDERGRFVIALLSGHIGGANALARRVAALTGGQAVLTTSSDVQGLTALDLWCQAQQLVPASKAALTHAMGLLADRGSLRLWCEPGLEGFCDDSAGAETQMPEPRLQAERRKMRGLPPDLHPVDRREDADLLLSCHREAPGLAALLHPRALCIGLGCNRGTPRAEIAAAVAETLARHHLAGQAVAGLASIDLKADETGLLDFAEHERLPLVFFSRELLNAVPAASSSDAVFRATGAYAVAEPAALLAAGPGAVLLVPKTKWPNVTVAVARKPRPTPQPGNEKP